jgi:hypothetical protein
MLNYQRVGISPSIGIVWQKGRDTCISMFSQYDLCVYARSLCACERFIMYCLVPLNSKMVFDRDNLHMNLMGHTLKGLEQLPRCLTLMQVEDCW